MSAYSYRSSKPCQSITGTRTSGLTWTQINGPLHRRSSAWRFVYAIPVAVAAGVVAGVLM
ncbi:hypothetical protein [Novosphingobium sp. M1R2S20]|uniref:Uncharacterized protein n=1 Tax=Novosphingobium rhizovicinum TaxID=3228928 RepID=A0ABV3RCQ2_9SPHN